MDTKLRKVAIWFFVGIEMATPPGHDRRTGGDLSDPASPRSGAVLIAMFVGAPFVLISIASLIFFLIYLMVFVDLWILRVKSPDQARPFYAGGAKRLPVLSIIGFPERRIAEIAVS